MKKVINIITMIISIIISIVLLISIICNFEKIAVIIESITLTISFTVNMTFNIYFIKDLEKLKVDKVNLLKIAKANGVEIENNDSITIEKLVSNNFINYDDVIMENVIGLMDEFEYEIYNGGFTIYGPFNLDILGKPEALRRSIGTEKYICRDDKLNQYLDELKAELLIMANNLSFHSFSTPTFGFNKMRWIEMQEEMCQGKTFKDEHLKNEKKAFDEAENSIKKSISIYKEMINYWRKNRKVAE